MPKEVAIQRMTTAIEYSALPKPQYFERSNNSSNTRVCLRRIAFARKPTRIIIVSISNNLQNDP